MAFQNQNLLSYLNLGVGVPTSTAIAPTYGNTMEMIDTLGVSIPAIGGTPTNQFTSSSGAQTGGMGFMQSFGIGSSIGQAIGAMYSAFATASATEYVLKKQAEINEINKGKVQLGVESALRAGESQVAQITSRAGAVKAKQKASMAANGVTLGVGSAAELTTSTDVNKKLDVKATQENALAAAWGYSTKATQYQMLADTQRIGAKYQSDTAISQTINKGIETIGAVADRWYYYNKGY